MTDIFPQNWLDSMQPASLMRTGGTSLTFDELLNGAYAYRFDVGDVVHFQTQLNHGYKINSVIKPHLHLVNKTAITGTALPTFTLKWSWANRSASFPAITTVTGYQALYTNAAALYHITMSMGSLTPADGQGGVSSFIIGSIERQNTGYTANNIYLLGFDIHYENDSIGTSSEYSK